MARLHGLTANVVHLWRVDERKLQHRRYLVLQSSFMAVDPTPETCTIAQPLPPADICVEVMRRNIISVVMVHALQDSPAYAAWLRE